MGIGGSILLIVVGAILAFGMDNTHLGPFNLNTIGWILQLAGLVGLLLTLYFWNARRRPAAVLPPPAPPTVGTAIPPSPDEVIEQQRYTERRNY